MWGTVMRHPSSPARVVSAGPSEEPKLLHLPSSNKVVFPSLPTPNKESFLPFGMSMEAKGKNWTSTPSSQ